MTKYHEILTAIKEYERLKMKFGDALLEEIPPNRNQAIDNRKLKECAAELAEHDLGDFSVGQLKKLRADAHIGERQHRWKQTKGMIGSGRLRFPAILPSGAPNQQETNRS